MLTIHVAMYLLYYTCIYSHIYHQFIYVYTDAPALKQSDIGIAMGITGTEVAKQAADMVRVHVFCSGLYIPLYSSSASHLSNCNFLVKYIALILRRITYIFWLIILYTIHIHLIYTQVLADDDFNSILAAVEEGRNIYSNMQAFVSFLLSCNMGEIAAVAIASVIGLPSPLSPLHLLWVNLVTDGPPATGMYTATTTYTYIHYNRYTCYNDYLHMLTILLTHEYTCNNYIRTYILTFYISYSYYATPP